MRIDKIVVMAEACNYYIGIIDIEMWRGDKHKTYTEVSSCSISRLMAITRTPEQIIWTGGAYHLRIAIYPTKPDDYEVPF